MLRLLFSSRALFLHLLYMRVCARITLIFASSSRWFALFIHIFFFCFFYCCCSPVCCCVYHTWFYFNFQFVKDLGVKTSWIVPLYPATLNKTLNRKHIHAIAFALSNRSDQPTQTSSERIEFIVVIYSIFICSLAANGLQTFTVRARTVKCMANENPRFFDNCFF